jgi:hypothetical protein
MKNQNVRTAPGRAASLHTEELMRVRGPARLRVLRGHLWLTVDGQTDDHMLASGDRFVLGRGAGALVQALFAPACAVVVEEAAPAWPGRAGQALRLVAQRLAGVLA